MPTSENNVLVKQLIEFGLSEKEAKIYLALLELEVATVNEAAETADINRSSAYVVMDALKKKGLVSTSEGKIQKYVAVSPEMLLREAKDRVIKTSEIEGKISDIIPELKAMHKDTKHKPKVRVYEGKEGVKEAYWSLFTTRTTVKELRAYANPVNLFKYVPNFIEHDNERGKRRIKMYAINPATKEMLELYKKIRPQPPYEIALIPEEKWKFYSDIGIYGDQTAFLAPRGEYGIIIESKEITDLLKANFDLAWEEAKRLHKEIIGEEWKDNKKK